MLGNLHPTKYQLMNQMCYNQRHVKLGDQGNFNMKNVNTNSQHEFELFSLESLCCDEFVHFTTYLFYGEIYESCQ